jgi:hypothetical protein
LVLPKYFLDTDDQRPSQAGASITSVNIFGENSTFGGKMTFLWEFFSDLYDLYVVNGEFRALSLCSSNCTHSRDSTAVVLGRFRQNRVRAIPILFDCVGRNRTRFGIESGSDEPKILRK